MKIVDQLRAALEAGDTGATLDVDEMEEIVHMGKEIDDLKAMIRELTYPNSSGEICVGVMGDVDITDMFPGLVSIWQEVGG